MSDLAYKNILIMNEVNRYIKNGGVVVFIYALIIQSSLFAQFSHFQKKNWTVVQIKEWALNNQNQRWHGWLLYQGTDSSTHHFISRVFDEWVWFSINKKEIVIEDERVYKLKSKTLGYYYVDALNRFIKIKEY